MCCFNTPTDIQAQKIKLPEQFLSYNADEKLSYTPENLFNYINGGAELYLSYGFIGMTGCRYTGDDLPEVNIEIYEMTEAKNAFGVYTHSRDKEEYDYGQGSQSYTDAILFWKDRYFIIINTVKSTPQSTEAIRYLASFVDNAIPEKGKLPDIVGDLPDENLVPGGFIYFHHYVWINAYYFIADHNILNINEKTDAVLARYENDSTSSRCYLLLLKYPDSEIAKQAYEQLIKKYAPEAGKNQIIQLEDGNWFMTWRERNRLGAIFNGATLTITEQLYKNSIKKK